MTFADRENDITQFPHSTEIGTNTPEGKESRKLGGQAQVCAKHGSNRPAWTQRGENGEEKWERRKMEKRPLSPGYQANNGRAETPREKEENS